MRIVYISTAGSGDPTKASLPWHLAVNGSVEEGHDVVMVLVGDSVDLVAGGVDRFGAPASPPDVARLVAEADKVLTF